ncbi:MAG: hypothetical protein JWN94_948 [Betaproteobacteria bacterium]|nr:hypothetical protein [Betaproteobacteria bacterium]
MKGKVLGKITKLRITQEQFDKVKSGTAGIGGHQSLCQKFCDGVKTENGTMYAHVYDADMVRIKTLVDRPDDGSWQGVFREILGAN